MPRHLTLAIAAALVLATGCEGEGDTPPADEEGAFAAQAEEVCEGTRIELDAVRADLFDDLPMQAEEAQQSFERAGALLETKLTELRQLEGEEPEGYSNWLAELEAAAATYREAGESREAAEELAGGDDPLVDAERTADELGLRACGTERQVDPDLSPPPEG